MSLFDDLLVNAKTAAGTVSKKTEEFVDSAKLRISIAEIKSELSKKYETLGRYVFDILENDEFSHDKLTEKINDIRELEHQLEITQKSRDRVHSKSKCACTACGAQLDEDCVFCSRCGTRRKNI